MVRKPFYRTKENLAGGKGVIEFYDVIHPEEMGKAGRLFTKIVVNPGCSLGYHQHVGETEPYFITAGKGLYTDSDGTQTVVSAGDVCMINLGESHGIENPFDEVLEIIAVIYNDIK